MKRYITGENLTAAISMSAQANKAPNAILSLLR